MTLTPALLELVSLLLLATLSIAAVDSVERTAAASLLGQSVQALPAVFCCSFAYYCSDCYDPRIFRDFSEFRSRSLHAVVLVCLLLGIIWTLFPFTRTSIVFVLPAMAFLAVPLRWLIYRWFLARAPIERVLIVGTGQLASRIADAVRDATHLRCTLLGLIDDGNDVAATRDSSPYRVIAGLGALTQTILELSPDRIIVAPRERRKSIPFDELLRFRLGGLLVEDGIKAHQRLTGKLPIETLTARDLIFVETLNPSRRYLVLKRAMSVMVTLPALVLGLPLMILIPLLIRLDSKGPIFFTQDRIGLRGRSFKLIKFRSMVVSGHNGSQWERDNTARVTRVGYWLRKYHLDELPQFFNILRGDMDLVGPRPHPYSNYELFEREIPYYFVRSMSRPGLTGWSQVRIGYANGLAEETNKMQYDLYYLERQSLALDLRILLETLKIVLFGREAVDQDAATTRRAGEEADERRRCTA
jgi:exopolysaccharide biosynthesis polyprenyl glycosylphosphotransferase